MTTWIIPVAGAAQPSGGSLFGVPRTGHTHAGIDINAPGWAGGSVGAGTPILAAASGTAHLSSSPNGGWIVRITHDNGWSTVYMHLGTKDKGVKPYAVSDGQRVEAGQVIGFMGDTGNPAVGAYHLHFEIHDPSGGAVDPMGQQFGNPTVDTPEQKKLMLRTLLDEMSLSVAGGQRNRLGGTPYDARSLLRGGGQGPMMPPGPPQRGQIAAMAPETPPETQPAAPARTPSNPKPSPTPTNPKEML